MKAFITFLASLTITFLMLCGSSAETQLSNLQQGYSANFGIGSGSPGGQGAVQIRSDSLSPIWTVDSVTLVFGGPVQWGTRANGPILYSAYLYNGSNTAPSSQLAFLGSFNFTNQTQDSLAVTFVPTDTISMNSASDYWVIVSAVTACPSGILAGTSGRFNEVTGSGWQYGTFGSLFSSGTFLESPGGSATPFVQIQASAQTIPEPNMLSLIAVSGLVLLYRRLRCSEPDHRAPIAIVACRGRGR